MFKKFSSFSYKYSVVLCLLLFLILGLEGYYLKNNFKVDTNLKALFKGTNETVQKLEKMEKRIGGTSNLLIVVNSPDREKNIAFFSELKKKIEGHKSIRFVDFDRDVSYLEEHGFLFLPIDELEKIHDEVRDAIRKKVKTEMSFDDNGSEKEKDGGTEFNEDQFKKLSEKIEDYKKKYNIRRYFEVENGTFLAMKVRQAASDTSVSKTKKLVQFLEKTVADIGPEKYGVKVEVGGYFRNKIKEIDAIYNDLFSTLGICLFLLCLTIIFYFRSFLSLFLILLPLSAGVMSSATAMQFFLGDLNIISAFSFAILYGLGIDFGIHLLGRYSEEKSRGFKPVEAMYESYRHLVPAVFSGAATTAVAFLTLVLIEFKGFSDFGLAAAIGVTTSFISIILFFPALVFVFEKVRPLKVRVREITFIPKLYSALSSRPRLLFSSLIIFVLAAIISLNYIEVEYNFDKLSFPNKNDEDSLSSKYRAGIRKEKSDTFSTGLPSYILTDTYEETEDVSRELQRIKEEQPFDIPLKDYMSVYSFIPEKQDEKLKIVKRIHRLIERKINMFDEKAIAEYKKEIEPMLSVRTKIEKDKLPEWIVDKLAEKDGTSGKFIVVSLSGNKSTVTDVLKIKKYYGKIKGKIKEYDLLGSYMLLGDIKDVIEVHVPRAVLLSFLAVFLVLMILFRSFKKGILVMVPLASGLLWMMLVVFISGMKMNVFNMIVIPTVVGIGIDSAIHIYHRYKSSGVEEMDKNLIYTGGAVLFSSLTTFVGFASIAFAQHRGLNSIGVTASIGIITVTIANLVYFPAVLKYLGTRK